MASTNTASAKTHVSLRLPTYLLESIDAHAERESISRTEAFVFYLQTGLDIADTKAEEPSKDESMLLDIQEELAEIKALLISQNAVSEQASNRDETPLESVDVPSENPVAEFESDAEMAFTTSDAASEETPAEEESVEEPVSSTPANPFAPAEQTAGEDLMSADAPAEESLDEEDDDTNDAEDVEDESTTSDATAEEPSYAVDDEETYTEIKPVDDMSSFMTSDEVYDASGVEDQAEDEDEIEDKEEVESTDIAEETPSYFSSFYATSSSLEEDDVEEDDIEEVEQDVISEDLYPIASDLESEELEESEEEFDSVSETAEEVLSESEAETEEVEPASEFFGGAFMTYDEPEAYTDGEIEDEDEDEETLVDPCDEALSFKKLEKAVTKASKQIDIIEKVWLFGAAATEESITAPIIDLCVKTDDDKKLKSKHLDPFVAAIEEKTGKIVNVVLRHEIEDKSELQNRVELYKN